MNTVEIIGALVMMIGVAIIIGIFNQLGPITTPKGMKRLGICVVAIGFVIALTQSTPTP